MLTFERLVVLIVVQLALAIRQKLLSQAHVLDVLVVVETLPEQHCMVSEVVPIQEQMLHNFDDEGRNNSSLGRYL